jgi:hypothetical protein
MKKILIFLVVSFLLVSCQPKSTPTPQIQEVTRIVDQTVEVPQIIKETIVVTELVEVAPTKQPVYAGEFELKPEHFDAMLALYKFFNYLDTKDCVANYYAHSKHNQRANLDDTIVYCEKAIGNVEVISVYPFNYQYYLKGKRLVIEPEGHIYLTTFVLWEEMSLGKMEERPILFYVDMVWEEEAWKVNATNTSPFF